MSMLNCFGRRQSVYTYLFMASFSFAGCRILSLVTTIVLALKLDIVSAKDYSAA